MTSTPETNDMCSAADAKFVIIYKDGTWRFEADALDAEIASSYDDFLVCVPLT